MSTTTKPNLLLEMVCQELVYMTTDQIKNYFLDTDNQRYFQALSKHNIYAFEYLDEMIPWESLRTNLEAKLEQVTQELSESINDINVDDYLVGYNDVSIDDYTVRLEPEYSSEYYLINDAIDIIFKQFEI
jgi:hypothetical protein